MNMNEKVSKEIIGEPSPSAILTFMRHGEKDDSGNLTHAGRLQAKNSGFGVNHLNGEIILFHSGVDRVRETVRTMAAHLHLSKYQEEMLELGENITEYIVPDLHFLINPKNKGVYFSDWDNISHDKDSVISRIENFLSMNNSIEPDIFYSPKKMAKNVARIIDTEIRFANLTDSSHKVNFVNGSHEPVLMSFLHYFLNDYHPSSAKSIRELGDPIDFAESFDISIYSKNKDEFVVNFSFRDIKRTIDMEKLRKFAYSN